MGGHLLEASAPEFKKDLRPLLKWLKTQLDREGVEVRLNTTATRDLVKEEGPDVLVLALGSEYAIPAELADKLENFVLPVDVLLGRSQVGERVVVAGGGFVGCETALHIGETLKRKATICEMRDDILSDYPEPVTQMALRVRLMKAGVEVRTGVTLRGFSQNRALLTDKAGKAQQMDADTLVLATGLKPRREGVAGFEGLAPKLFKVGDCVRPGKIYDAFRSARHTVLHF